MKKIALVFTTFATSTIFSVISFDLCIHNVSNAAVESIIIKDNSSKSLEPQPFSLAVGHNHCGYGYNMLTARSIFWKQNGKDYGSQDNILAAGGRYLSIDKNNNLQRDTRWEK